MEKEFERVRSLRDIIISAAMAAVGIVLIILPTSVSVNIFGTCLAVPGLLMLLFLKTDYRDVETGVHFRRFIKYYPASRKAEILSALKTDPSQMDWSEKSVSDGLMLDVYEGREKSLVYARLSEFVPYSYEPCSEWFQYDESKAAALVK